MTDKAELASAVFCYCLQITRADKRNCLPWMLTAELNLPEHIKN